MTNISFRPDNVENKLETDTTPLRGSTASSEMIRRLPVLTVRIRQMSVNADVERSEGCMRKAEKTLNDPLLVGLGDRPGFLIRRAHQISQSVFTEECASLDITSTQFGVLSILARAGELDQISIARLLGFDRSTTGLVVKLLEDRALIVRSSHATDRRRHVLRLTEAGDALRRRAEPLVDRVKTRLEEVFTPAQARTFFELLDKFTRSFDETARVPLQRSPAPKPK